MFTLTDLLTAVVIGICCIPFLQFGHWLFTVAADVFKQTTGDQVLFDRKQKALYLKALLTWPQRFCSNWRSNIRSWMTENDFNW